MTGGPCRETPPRSAVDADRYQALQTETIGFGLLTALARPQHSFGVHGIFVALRSDWSRGVISDLEVRVRRNGELVSTSPHVALFFETENPNDATQLFWDEFWRMRLATRMDAASATVQLRYRWTTEAREWIDNLRTHALSKIVAVP